jgi:Holliday junction resolvase
MIVYCSCWRPSQSTMKPLQMGVVLTGRASQRKGRDGELELARVLQEYGYDAQPGRAQSYGEVPDLTGLPGVHIECKRVERLNVPEAMKQAVRDAEKFLDGAPTLFHRRNREPWLVTMKLEDWLSLYQRKD